LSVLFGQERESFWDKIGIFIFFFEKGMAFLKGICGKFLLLEWKKSQTNK